MILFKPNGLLNVATEPSDLPQSGDGKSAISDALVRCKNLRVDRQGVLKTRDGSSKLNGTAITATELVTNGTFTSDISSWTDQSAGGSISWSAGAMLMNSTSGPAAAEQAISIASTNVEHTLTFSITPSSGTAPVQVTIGSGMGGAEIYGPIIFSSAGENAVTFTPTLSTVYLRFTKTLNPVSLDLDTVSIKRTVTPVNLIIEQGGTRYAFGGNNIYSNESSIASGLTDAQWSGILYNSYNDSNESVFALNGTDRKRITASTVAEWGSTAPSAPTTAVGASTGLTGTYNAKITYCRKVSSTVVYETNPSSAGTARALANQSLSVSWAASSDSQITHVRVYRTTANGSVYYHDQDVAIGSTSVDTNTADASLGDSPEDDHDRPPLGTVVLGPAYDGVVFIIKDNLLYYSKAKQPEYWPTDNFIEVSQLQFPLQTGAFHNGQLYVMSKEDIFYIQGTGTTTFFPIKLKAITGAQGLFGAISIPGKGIYHTGYDGIYLLSGTDQKMTESAFDPIFRGETVQGIPGVSSMTTAWLHQFSNRLYFGYASTGNTYPNNVLSFNIDTGRSTYFNYNDGSEVVIRCITTDRENNRLLVGDTVGFVRTIESTSATTDSGAAISWECQSKDFTLQTRAHFPRWNKYDVDSSSAVTAFGRLLLDGAIFQSHTLSDNRSIKRRLIKTGNGERCAIRLDGTGPVSIYAVEAE